MPSTPREPPKLLKPVNHVVLAFPEEAALRDAAAALGEAGFGAEAIHEFSAVEMHAALNAELEAAGPLASLGQDTNLAEFHRQLAGEGHGWLLVHAPANEETERVAAIARRFGARLAQKYNRFTIEELM